VVEVGDLLVAVAALEGGQELAQKSDALAGAQEVEAAVRHDLVGVHLGFVAAGERGRSEEHTSELQSPCNFVCRLLLEIKKVCLCRTRRSRRCTLRRARACSYWLIEPVGCCTRFAGWMFWLISTRLWRLT